MRRDDKAAIIPISLIPSIEALGYDTLNLDEVKPLYGRSVKPFWSGWDNFSVYGASAVTCRLTIVDEGEREYGSVGDGIGDVSERGGAGFGAAVSRS